MEHVKLMLRIHSGFETFSVRRKTIVSPTGAVSHPPTKEITTPKQSRIKVGCAMSGVMNYIHFYHPPPYFYSGCDTLKPGSCPRPRVSPGVKPVFVLCDESLKVALGGFCLFRLTVAHDHTKNNKQHNHNALHRDYSIAGSSLSKRLLNWRPRH